MLKGRIERIIFDADDTLWENNVFFVQAESDLVNLVEKAGFDRSEISKRFSQAEIRVVSQYGYGSKYFIFILEDVYKYYMKQNGFKEYESQFRELVTRFETHPERTPQLFPGVRETLQELRKRYEIYILTKGDYEEQLKKITLSGLMDLIDQFFIPAEKNDAYYRHILEKMGWKAERTCMVGNSPKSDINPALRLGMYAVFIPYEHTWQLESETLLKDSDRMIELERFTQLADIL